MPVSASPVRGRRVYATLELPALLALLFAAAAAWFFLSYVPRERTQAVESWRRDLSVRADVRKDAIQRFFVDGLADAEVFASYPTVLEVLGTAFADAGSLAAHLEELFDSYVRIHGIVGVVLWDAEGKVAARSRDIQVEAACAAPAREVLASGSPATGLHLHEGFGPILTFAAPVRLPDGSVRGAVVVAEDPRKWLYPLLSQPLAGTTSGESFLVGRDGADAVSLSPRRGRLDAPLRFRRPLDTLGSSARAALEGTEAVGRFVDYRGVPVLAVGRRIPPSP